MQKRNFILFIIILIIVLAVIFGFLYFQKSPTTPGGDDGGTNFFSQFNPFGKSNPSPGTETPTNNETPGGAEPETPLEIKLKKVSSMPIAGYTVYQKERFKEVPVVAPGEFIEPATSATPSKPVPPPTEFAPALRYVARATGNVYQTFADKIEERKFSSTIVPKVYEAYFGNKGEAVVMRYTKTDAGNIETFVGGLPKELLGGDTTSNNEIKGVFLPQNTSDLSVSPDTAKIFYLFPAGDGVAGVIADALGDKKSQVFDSPFTEWLSFWPNEKIITLTTKPSSSVPGYMYAIDPNKKDQGGFSRVLGDINGLTTLGDPGGKLILYGDNGLSLSIYDTTTRTSKLLGVKTLPEKCAWNKTGTTIYCAVPSFIERGLYPDDWYRGEVSFADKIWKIDIDSGNATFLLDPITIVGGEETDGIKLALDEGENYLFFINKKDSYLWKLDLK